MAFKRHISTNKPKYLHEINMGIYFAICKQKDCSFKMIKIIFTEYALNLLSLSIGENFEIYIDDENPYLFMFKKTEDKARGYTYMLTKYGNRAQIRFFHEKFTSEIKNKSAILTINEDGSFIVDCSH